MLNLLRDIASQLTVPFVIVAFVVPITSVLIVLAKRRAMHPMIDRSVVDWHIGPDLMAAYGVVLVIELLATTSGTTRQVQGLALLIIIMLVAGSFVLYAVRRVGWESVNPPVPTIAGLLMPIAFAGLQLIAVAVTLVELSA